jgi:heme-degrading monooxygenase HmoA
MHLLIVKFQSAHSDADVLRILEARVPLLRAVPGLRQKYYTREAATGAYAGVHLFDSQDALEQYRRSDVARSISSVFQVLTPPRVETLELLFPLRLDAAFDRPVERAVSSAIPWTDRGEP